MNANEARTISLQNSSQLAESIYTNSISQIDSTIKDEAKKGNFKAIFQTVLLEPLLKANFAERIVEHYKAKGFNVEVAPYVFAVRFTISWDIEGDGFY